MRHVLWEDPQPLANRLNAEDDDHEPTVASDNRTMVFVRGRAGKNTDLYMSRWAGDIWDTPRPLTSVNTPFDESSPAISRDGRDLYFSSNRPGGLGGYDLWVAHWSDGAWVEPVNLGPRYNSPGDETGPALSPDGKHLYFSSNRPKEERAEMDKILGKKGPANGDYDIFVAELEPGTPSSAQRVDELNSTADDVHVGLTPRGDFIYFSSARPGGHGGMDIYRSRFLEGKLQQPQNLGGPINTSANEIDPVVWMEGYDLVFTSNRNSPNAEQFFLYHSVSREVIATKDYTALTQKLSAFTKLKWSLLVFVFALIALLFLLRRFMNEQWRDRTSLLQKCLVGSAIVHAALAFLFSLWGISSAIYQRAGLPFMQVALDDSALAEEKLSLDISEQVTDLSQQQQQQSVTLPPQEKVEQLPVARDRAIEPPKQDLKPATSPAKIETAAAEMSMPASGGESSGQQLQPVQHAREIAGTYLVAGPAQLESPQPIVPQTSKELPSAPTAVDLRPVKTGARPQGLAGPVIVAAASALPAGISGSGGGQSSHQPAALDGELPVSESRPATSVGPAGSSSGSGKTPGALAIGNQVAMESGKPTGSQGTGPQVGPLPSGPSLASVAGTENSLPQGRPQSAPQSIPGGGTANIAGQGSALGGELPVAESQAPTRLAGGHGSSKTAAGSLEIKNQVAMESGGAAGSAGTGPEIKPLQAGQSLAQLSEGTGSSLPAGQPQKVTDNVGAGGTGGQSLHGSALEGQLPVAEAAAAAHLGPATASGSGKAMGSLQIESKLALESDKPGAPKGNGGADIQPLKTDSTLATGPVGGANVPQQQPQKIVHTLGGGGTGGNTVGQGSALGSGLPVQESQTGTRVMAGGSGLTNTVGSLGFQPQVKMEAEQPARVAASRGQDDSAGNGSGRGGGQDIKPAQSKSLAASAVSQFPGMRGEPQKIANQIGAGGGTLGVVLPQSGPVRPIESTPNRVEMHGPGTAPHMRIPALQLMASVALDSANQAPPTYLLRDQKQRSNVIEALGGTAQTEAAIVRSLDWLSRHQESDGHWAILKHGGLQGHDVGATALALLSYMGWGAKHTEPGPYQTTIARGLDWLTKQVKYKGDMRNETGTMYDHGMGTIALAEAYSLTKDPNLLPPLRRAVDFILQAQNPSTGGWRYIPGAEGDTSVFGWQLMALKSASLAGLEIPPHAMENARRWLDHVSSGDHGGLYGYQDKVPLPAMCAEGMFCQQLLGRPPSDQRMEETAEYLATLLPSKEKDKVNYYYWYYGSLAMYQHQGPHWEQWNEKIRDILVKSQKTKGDDTGSWDPAGQWGRECGRAVTTALATLSLEVYYRYLPLYGLTVAAR